MPRTLAVLCTENHQKVLPVPHSRIAQSVYPEHSLHLRTTPVYPHRFLQQLTCLDFSPKLLPPPL